MIDAIGTLRLSLPGSPEQAHRARAAAAVAKAVALGAGVPSDRGGGDPVLLVRQLSLNIALPRSEGLDEFAAAAGRSLEPALRSSLARPPGGLDLVTFESLAEYLAHFVEQCLHERPVDAWYFGPLSDFVAPTLADTLQRLAEAEPEAWPAVLATLRARGLFPLLLRRLPPHGHALLFGAWHPSRRLGLDEARPLFAAAWNIVAACLDRPRTGSATSLPFAGGSGSGMDAAVTLRRFLATNPEAPRSWADPKALSESVAAMIRWLLALCPPRPRNHAAAESELTACRWLDPSPLRVVLSEATRSRSVSAAGPVLGSAGNRSQALQYLSAMRSSAGRDARAATFDPVLAGLLHRLQLSDADGIERLLVGPPLDVALPSESAGALQRLRTAARFLTRNEVRILAKALATSAGVSADAEVPTRAAGLFLLIRPLIDLRLSLFQSGDVDLVRALLLEMAFLAGEPNEPVVAAIVATGRLPDARGPVAAGSTPLENHGALRAYLLARGESLRLGDTDEAAPTPVIALELCCRQLVRWLSGFERSSVDYVLRKIVRCPGHIRVPAEGPVSVVWPGSGFDVVLDRAGYLDPIQSVPWWDGRGLQWQR